MVMEMTTITPEELQRRMRKLSEATKPALLKGMTDAAMNVETKAKENCTPGSSPYYRAPHVTGTMYRSIASKADIRRNEVVGIVHAGGEKANYALDVHEGTSRMPPRPYILDAIIAEKNNTLKFLSDALEGGIRRHTI